jgi:hypothetical protein
MINVVKGHGIMPSWRPGPKLITKPFEWIELRDDEPASTIAFVHRYLGFGVGALIP